MPPHINGDTKKADAQIADVPEAFPCLLDMSVARCAAHDALQLDNRAARRLRSMPGFKPQANAAIVPCGIGMMRRRTGSAPCGFLPWRGGKHRPG